MISVCVNLARAIGLRSTVRCLRIVLDWLGVTGTLPDWTTIRTWLMRVGVAAIEEPIERADDWVWMADHSNQIGPEKALVILGLRASKMPPPGVSLAHQDIRLLCVEPGVSWKREDMARAYKKLADKIGSPMALIVDGAVELREVCEIYVATGVYAISHPADRTGSFDPAESPAQSPLHESGHDAQMGQDGVVATLSSTFPNLSWNRDRTHERKAGLAENVSRRRSLLECLPSRGLHVDHVRQ
jgi:hypothetical protein